MRRTSCWTRHQFVGVEHGARLRLLGAGRLEQHAPLGVEIGIEHVDLHQEAVELRLGKGIGALLLDRVLRGEHVERPRQVVALAGDGDVVLLHGLQQRRLRARAGAVDLVGHQELREDRAAHEAEAPPVVGALLEDLRAEDVGGHQVGRELDAAGGEPEHRAHRVDELGLGEAGHADEQPVAAGEHRGQRPLHHRLLAEDHVGDSAARASPSFAAARSASSTIGSAAIGAGFIALIRLASVTGWEDCM